MSEAKSDVEAILKPNDAVTTELASEIEPQAVATSSHDSNASDSERGQHGDDAAAGAAKAAAETRDENGVVDAMPTTDLRTSTSTTEKQETVDGTTEPGNAAEENNSSLPNQLQELRLDGQSIPGDASMAVKNKGKLPASPPPPAPPRKDTDARKTSALDTADDARPAPTTVGGDEVPEAPQGSTEVAGSEIQDIMDQFQAGAGGMDEKEIMSPRLERQQSVLVLPPRTSSLEHRDTPLSPQSVNHVDPVAIPTTAHGADGHPPDKPSVDLDGADETESVSSTRAGSIFQPPPLNPDPEPSLPFDFHRFLEQLRHRTADPVARFLRSFLTEFGKKQWMVHEQVKIISDFLEFIAKKMAQCDVWRTVSDAEFDNAREGMEKLVMNRLYSQTFSPAIPPAAGSPRKGARPARSQADAASPVGPGRRGQHQEDVERDDVIAQKIRIYGWIREEHLDIKPVGDKGRKFLTLAQQELLKINTYRAPRDKVICVLNCCKVIFGFLKNSKSDQSADAFVPLLIYTVLQARPEHLVSNVQYIWRFRNQDKLGGEAGYYMSSLMGVVTFVESLDRTTLTVTDEEFERNVEQAVSAIAEENKSEEYESKTHSTPTASPMHHIGEKSTLSRPEVTPRNSMDAEQSSPRRKLSQRLNAQAASSDDDSDAVSGLLRTIQRPLHTIGRIFSDDTAPQVPPTNLRPPSTPAPGSTPRRLSPSPQLDRRSSTERSPSRIRMQAEEAAARQASAEVAEAQRVRVREHAVVVETLQNMFPALDKDVIQDVVRAQEGNVGKAVDACLAMSGD